MKVASGGDFDPFSSLNAEDSVETTWIWPSNRSADILETAAVDTLLHKCNKYKRDQNEIGNRRKSNEDKLSTSFSSLQNWKPELFAYPESEPNLSNLALRKDMTNLQSWGFNAIRPGAQVAASSKSGNVDMSAVRLGVMWPGVEPVEGEYNHTYLQANKGEDWKMALADVFYPPIPLHTLFFC